MGSIRISTMLKALVLLLFVVLASASPTQWLGQPGLPWTEEEILAVKAKLVKIFLQKSLVYKEYMKLHPEKEDLAWSGKLLPNAAKLLRLGFHDCLTTEGGGGGCNGCLNPTGMRKNTLPPSDERLAYEPDGFTNNNGLSLTADILEEIYTNPKFPKKTPQLSISLAESGKSRADLWAFASLVGAAWGIERNNNACTGKVGLGDTKGFGHILGPTKDHPGTDRCLLSPTTIPLFRTGRVDCQPEPSFDDAWETSEHEIHPNVASNGVQTADYFKEHFNLTGREGAALLVGAHSFGKFNSEVGLFKYSWTRQQEAFLNNQLFRHLAMRPQYALNFDKGRSQTYLTGDHLGQPAETRWLVRGNKFTPSGGPFQWGHWYHRCPFSNECAKMTPDMAVAERNISTTYPDYPKDSGSNRAEPDTPDGCCNNLENGSGRCNPECQRYIVNDETALSADTGYMFAFDVSEATGLPTGCNAFDEANNWSDDTEKKGYAGPIDCPLQTYAPEGEPLHRVVEEFADDQNAWLHDFLPALQKMVENKAKNLVEAPAAWWDAECVDKGKKGLVCS